MKEKNTIEQKVDALAGILLAESEDAKKAAVAQLKELMEGPPLSRGSEKHSLEWDVRQLLTEIGVPDHVKGSRYLVSALCLCVENPNLIDAIVGELYPGVADLHDTTGSRVERAIRHAIEISCDRCDRDTYYRFFGGTISSMKGKPTNSEFIARLSNVIIMRRAS